ncbi:MAG TPA: hypothetical protein VFA20_33545, partial [Myxococcaceae bacterium]|nr:hypothetical protein [Myxococcaceae bacterium]
MLRCIWWIAAALAVMEGSAKAEEQLGECAKEMRPKAIFQERKRPTLRVLVTRFRGGNSASEEVGAEAGFNLSQELHEYFHNVLGKEEVLATGLDPDDLQVAYVPCTLAQHHDARVIGQAW